MESTKFLSSFTTDSLLSYFHGYFSPSQHTWQPLGDIGRYQLTDAQYDACADLRSPTPAPTPAPGAGAGY